MIPPYDTIKSPSSIALATIAVSFASRKLTGVELGINTTNFKSPIKAFLTFIVIGQILTYVYEWENKK